MSRISRRKFLEGSSAGLVAATTLPAVAADPRAGQAVAAEPAAAIPRTAIRIEVNGAAKRVEVEDRWTLAELLRDRLGLTGTKIGCDRGECGSCTVLLDGRPIYACSYLAVWADGRSIQTVEGLARPSTASTSSGQAGSGQAKLDPLQVAFIEHDGPQCGFCTPGQLMSAKALLARTPQPTAEEVRAALAGNLCRCSNYNRYVEAVLAAATPARPTAASATREDEDEGGGS